MKRYKVKFSSDFRQDFYAIYDYIVVDLDNPMLAAKIIRAVTDRIKTLEVVPKISAVKYRVDGRSFRALRVMRYSLLYLVDEKGKQVTVYRMIMSRRDIGEMMRKVIK